MVEEESMKVTPLTAEEKADYLWSEGWQLPDVMSGSWERWVEYHYSLVTAGEEQWHDKLRTIEMYDNPKLNKKLATLQRARVIRGK